ncbi:hypothetical protein AB0M02_43750 [Actinoplanes sp. NPDC051861]|uniref:hypothetical protein n=1 Tax=Actinoplanes sp. NPDC051861 TaxID=3155170 RepID=UPI00342C82B5
MTKLMESMGERMLRRLLNSSDAGACVDDFGAQCRCEADTTGPFFCQGGKKYFYKKRWNFDCNGRCTKKTSTTCGTWTNNVAC